MTRIIIAIIFLLSICPAAWGATYYVDPANGVDSNAGTATNAAWKNLQYAAQLLAQGDTVNIMSTKTSPSRGGLNTAIAGGSGANIITMQGNGGTLAYITSFYNVSHGASIGDYLTNGDLQSWVTTAIWGWSSSPGAGGSITKETTIVPAGKAVSVKFVEAGVVDQIEQDFVYLPANTSVTLSHDHYQTEADYRFTFYVKDVTDNKYLQNNGTWGASQTAITQSYTGPAKSDANWVSNGSWSTDWFTFTTNTSGRYLISVNLPYATTSYLANLSLTAALSTYSWTDQGDNTYALSPLISATPTIFTKATSAQWTTAGMAALVPVQKASSLDNCKATDNTWWWDSTANTVFYNPPAGEDPTVMHIEISRPRIGETSNDGAVLVDQQYYNFNYLHASGGTTAWNVAAANTTLTNCQGLGAGSVFYVNNVTSTLTSCSGSHSTTEDIFHVTGASGVLNGTKLYATLAYDDGFQSSAGGALNCNYCISDLNGRQGQDDNTGFTNEGAGSSMSLYNCVATRNTGSGAKDAGTGTSIVKNSIFWGNVTGEGAGKKDVESDGAGLTATHNIYGGQDGWPVDATDKTSDPKFISNTTPDFRLQSSSPAINTGTAWMAGTANYADFSGYEITNASGAVKARWLGDRRLTGVDIGAYAYQSAGGGGGNSFGNFNFGFQW